MSKGFIKIDRSLLAYIDRTKPLSRFEAITDIIQSAVGSDELVVTTHGIKVRLSKGHLIMSIADCQRRWNWSEKAVRLFIARLISDGVLTKVGQISKVGTVYNVVGMQKDTIKGIVNYLIVNNLNNTKGTDEGTDEGTTHLSYKDKITKKKEKRKNFNVSDEQWKRFTAWAGQNIPGIAGQITAELYGRMMEDAKDTSEMAEALIHIAHNGISIDKYTDIIKQKPWTEGHRSSGSSREASSQTSGTTGQT